MSTPVLGYAGLSASARSVLMGLLLLFSAAATAYTPLEIGPDFEALDLQPYVQLAIDEHDNLGPEQVLDQTDLRLNTSARNNLGFMAKTLWIRFQLASATDGPDLVLLKIGYPLLDQVTLYVSHADGSQQRFERGGLDHDSGHPDEPRRLDVK